MRVSVRVRAREGENELLALTGIISRAGERELCKNIKLVSFLHSKYSCTKVASTTPLLKKASVFGQQ